MRDIRVSLNIMHADRRTKTDAARYQDRLSKSSCQVAIPCAKRDQNSRRDKSTSETRAIMSNECNQSWTDAADGLTIESHEMQILWHKDGSHADDKNRGAGCHQAHCSRQKQTSPGAQRGRHVSI